MHLFDGLTLSHAGAHIGLVRRHNQLKSGRVQPLYGFDRSRQKLKLLHGPGSDRLAVAQEGPAEHTVPVEKHRRTQGHFRSSPSHLLGCCMRLGCETSPCHTTAWKDSV